MHTYCLRFSLAYKPIAKIHRVIMITLLLQCVTIAAFDISANADGGNDIYQPTKGQWLELQLRLDNIAAASIDKQGCQIGYFWRGGNKIQIVLSHLKSFNKSACELNLKAAEGYTRTVAKSFGWGWIDVEATRKLIE